MFSFRQARHQLGILGVTAAVAAVSMVGLAGVASAQTGYPGTTTSTTAPPSNQTFNEGTLTGTDIFESCGFLPNSTVQLDLNGVNIGTDSVEGNGCATQTVQVAGTAAGRPALAAIGGIKLFAQQASRAILIDGRTFNARVGTNTLIVSGTSSANSARSVTHTFVVSAAAAGGGLARTGGMIAKWAAAGAVLIGLGALMVTTSRKRRAGQTTI